MNGDLMVNYGIGIRKFQLTESAFAKLLAVTFHVTF
jgi:hypothetical protein